jgi:glutathione S-transferase
VAYPQIPLLIDRGRKRTEQFFDRIEQRLTDTKYLAGANYSLADISLLVVTDFAAWVEIEPKATRPHLARWYDTVNQRPTVCI